jgi:hypothetical protein
MFDAFFWGMISTSSLIVGGLLGTWFNVGKRTLGLVMAFGAGGAFYRSGFCGVCTRHGDGTGLA